MSKIDEHLIPLTIIADNKELIASNNLQKGEVHTKYHTYTLPKDGILVDLALAGN